MPFKNNLTRLMNMHNLNRTKLAKEIGVSPSTINSWYNRSYENVSLKTLLKLSSYFNISIEELVNEMPEKTIVFSSNDFTEEELAVINSLAIMLKNHRKEDH